ncbi:MAG: hypothetical protein LUG83_06240 [Lachnospiraceae bacterium]|nr:hypothetical protein [Lachnospiraceae bacterium]
MKKLSTTLALGLSLALALGTTAFAAESPSTTTVDTTSTVSEVSEATDSDGNAVTVTIDAEISETAATALDTSATTSVIESAVGSDKAETAAKVAVFEVDAGGAKNVTITFKLDSGSFNTDVYDYFFLHYNGSAWEYIAANVKSATEIEGTFASLSPVAIMQVEKDTGDDDDSSSETTASADGTATSPKTADTASYAGIIALAALAGAAVTFGRLRYGRR